MTEKAHTALESELAKLPERSLLQLRASWPERWGEAPVTKSADLLRRIVAWRLQAEAFGGLDDETLAGSGSGRTSRSFVLARGSRENIAGCSITSMSSQTGSFMPARVTEASPTSPATSPARIGMALASSGCADV